MADAASTDDTNRLAANAASATTASLSTLQMPFLGREDDIARVLALIDDPSVRLLTLTGTGGVGKTRLAQEIARRVGPEFADGVLYVPLVSVSDPGPAALNRWPPNPPRPVLARAGRVPSEGTAHHRADTTNPSARDRS